MLIFSYWTVVYTSLPQIAAGLGFDMASLINNPAFISMVRARVLTGAASIQEPQDWFYFLLD